MLNAFDYVTNNDFFKKFAVDDLLFVQYKCLVKESPFDYWTHADYFVYIVAGEKKWTTRNQEYHLQKGDAVYIRKGAYTTERFDNEDFCALLIFLTDDFVRSVLEKYPESTVNRSDKKLDSIIPIKVDDVLSAYFQSVLSYFPRSASPPRELLKIKFEELILNILNSDQNRDLAHALRETQRMRRVSIRDIMESSFMYNMTLEEYAKLCARSLSAFKSDFQEIYQTTPGKWLLETRLHYAKCLIETTDESINDVAFRSGFKNTTHFVRVFKERYGMPPLQYRHRELSEMA